MSDNEPSSPWISSDPVGLKPGEIFWNNYRVIGIIGKGGVSTVYKAENVQTKQLVAIKVLHANKTHDEELVRRFVREAQTTTKLDEPHAIHIYEWGIDKSERPFMIMEYLSGETLAKRIQRGNGLNCGKAVEIMEQICSAVAAAHSLGIIHRDLKPDNVMLITRNGLEDFVKVVDFGIAKLEPTSDDPDAVVQLSLTRTGAILGTPAYMSPEQLRGRKADARSDIYSLGVIMYEMLTGKPPFHSKNTAEVVVGHLNVKPEAPSSVRIDLGIPHSLDDVVLRALSKNPWERPTAVQEFCQALLKAIDKTPQHSTTQTVPSRPATKPSPPRVPTFSQSTIDPVRKVCPSCRAITSGANFHYCLKCGQDISTKWLPYHKGDESRRSSSTSGTAGARARRLALLLVLAIVLVWAARSYLYAPIELSGKFVGILDHVLLANEKNLSRPLAKKLPFSKVTLLLAQHSDTVSGLLTTKFGQGPVNGKVLQLSPMLVSYELECEIHKTEGKLDIEMTGTFDKVLRSYKWVIKAFFQGPKTKPMAEFSQMTFSQINDLGEKQFPGRNVGK